MKDRFTVFVNGEPTEIYRGMKVKHALMAHDRALYRSCLQGRATVSNEEGFAVGLEGSLAEGARIFVRETCDAQP